MPASKVLIGVDLDRINPIAGAITLEQDITTNECYNEINKHLMGATVDVYDSSHHRRLF
jgi:23S rRNA U2552 (ribose-2'-O)-methylase RlmE/FtsJ